MKVMVLSARAAKNKKGDAYFKATINPVDSEGNVAAGVEFLIDADDFANLAGKCPCYCEAKYKFRADGNQRGFDCLTVEFQRFSDFQPLAAAPAAPVAAESPVSPPVVSAPPELPVPARAKAS